MNQAPTARLGAALLLSTTAAGLVAALPAGPTLAAAPAEAATLSTVSRSGTTVTFTAGAGRANDVQVFVDENNEMTVTDEAGIVDIPGDGCSVIGGDTAKCGSGAVTRVNVDLGDLDDEVRPQAAVQTVVNGQSGNDTMFGGLVDGRSQVTYLGGEGFDTASYVNADRFVTVTLENAGGDGRPDDNDNVFTDVETVHGTRFPDRLTGSSFSNVLDGRTGPDTLRGLGGNDAFPQDRFADGADDISGGEGRDAVFYDQRSGSVGVDLDGVADDGATDVGVAGEGDNVRGDVDEVFTGSGDDTLVGNGAANDFVSGAGADRLSGRGGDDDFGVDEETDADVDTVIGGAGNDRVFAADAARDVVRCGAGASDQAFVDAGLDTIRACELVGTT